MHHENLERLARQLRRARRNLATDSPFSPAWAATTEWVDELEREIRDLGVDPDDLTAMSIPMSRRTEHLSVA